MTSIDTKAAMSQQQLRRNIFGMIWPATIESVLQMMVGIVATAMVGRLGATAIGAVGLGNRIARIVWAIFQAIGTGATVLVARAIGARDMKNARSIALQALVVGVVLVLFFSTLSFIFALPILKWFGTDGELLEVSFSYLKLVIWGMPFMAVMQIVGAVLRGSGDTRTPMVVAFIMNVVNIIVSYGFIFGNYGFPKLGLNGAAWGAIIAQAIGAVIALWVLFKPSSRVSLRHVEEYKLSLVDIKRLLKIGAPVAAESLFWQFATLIMMRWIVGFGTVPLAAHQLGLTAESLSYMPCVGFSIAATAFVGQSLGEKNVDLAVRYVTEIRKWCLVFTAVTASGLFIFPRAILGILTSDVAVIELGRYYLMLMAVAQFPQQLSSVMIGALRGSGNTKQPMINAGIGLWLVRIVGGYIVGVVLGYGIIGVWVAMTFDIFTRFALNFRIYRQGKWKAVKEI